MARPTDYTKDMPKKALEYLNSYEELGDVVPLIEGLSIYLGISRDTIYDWCSQEDKKEFSDIVDIIRATKSRGLQNKALRKEIDTKISALLLGHEGYRDRKDITTNEKDINPDTENKVNEAVTNYLNGIRKDN